MKEIEPIKFPPREWLALDKPCTVCGESRHEVSGLYSFCRPRFMRKWLGEKKDDREHL